MGEGEQRLTDIVANRQIDRRDRTDWHTVGHRLVLSNITIIFTMVVVSRKFQGVQKSNKMPVENRNVINEDIILFIHTYFSKISVSAFEKEKMLYGIIIAGCVFNYRHLFQDCRR